MQELTLFDSELTSLSEWAIHLPQDACQNETTANTTESTTKTPIDDESHDNDNDKKQLEVRTKNFDKYYYNCQKQIILRT